MSAYSSHTLTLRTRKFPLKEKLPAALFELFFEETPANN